VMGLRRDGNDSEQLATRRADRDLGVEDVFAVAC
jgi:hypothetical protein